MTAGALNMAITDLADHILALRSSVPRRRAALVAISGIDGSGKGYVTAALEQQLTLRGLRIANVNIDGWLQLPDKRFNPRRPAEHFYENGIRFDEMFSRLVLPLRDQRAVELTAQHADATNAPTYFAHHYSYTDVDVILLEGILLFRRELRRHYDLAVWIDCTYDTALDRALARGQEGLPPEDVVRDYHHIYFAAQRLHMQRDNPHAAADLVITNDPRLTAVDGAEMARAGT